MPPPTTTGRTKRRAAGLNDTAKAPSASSQSRRRPRPESTAAKSRSKKKSNTTTTTTTTTTNSRPPPPPPPPAALVKLLQKNPDVLGYFQALNANLTADVQVWKDRAAAYQKENEKLKAERDKQSKDKDNSSSPEKKRKVMTPPAATAAAPASADSPEGDEESASPSVEAQSEQGEPITDSMFAFESSSDDDNDDDNIDGMDDNMDDKSQQEINHATAGTKSSTPIAHNMFHFESSSDDEDDDAIKEDGLFQYTETKSTPRMPVEAARNDALDIFPLLKEAYQAFETLGVVLVDRAKLKCHDESVETRGAASNDNEATPLEPAATAAPDGAAELLRTDNNNAIQADSLDASIREDATPEEQQRDRVVVAGALMARSDERVLADLLDSIQKLTRMQLDDKGNCVADNSNYAPFVGDNLIPSCNVHASESSGGQEEHPAAAGKLLVFRLLVILDNFCSPKISDDQWKSYFVVCDDDNDDDSGNEDNAVDFDVDAARCGLRGRKGLANLFVSQLGTQLSKSWAVGDRSLLLTNTFLHFIGESNTSKEINDASTSNEHDGSKGLMGVTKSQVRLSAMVERCWLAQMLAGLYISRDNSAEAVVRLVLNYMLSAIPALHLEDYPKLPPALSLVILEGLLHPDPEMMWWETSAPEECSFRSKLGEMIGAADDEYMESLLQSLACCVHTTAAICKERLQSPDGRIQDVSRVEIACYERLLESEASWIGTGYYSQSDKSPQEMAYAFVDRALQSFNRDDGGDIFGLKSLEPRASALEIALVLKGDAKCTMSFLEDAVTRCQNRSALEASFPLVALSCCRGIRQLEIRQLGWYQQRIGSLSEESRSLPWNDASKCMMGFLLGEHIGRSRLDHFQLACTAMLCAVQLADGRIALKAIQKLVEQESRIQDIAISHDITLKTTLFDTIRSVGQTPVVRVITLERRGDRMQAFMSQLQQDVMVVKAVAEFGPNGSTAKSSQDTTTDGFYFGCYAFDGRGRLAEVQERLERQVGSVSELNNLVATHWRPHDLKPFDKEAPDKDDLVRTSPTERACALSHIASWKGVIRSLQLSTDSTSESGTCDSNSGNQTKFFHRPDHLRRLFRVSGFAEGPALLVKNANMPPAPVCVILEDDAILVDDFSTKLKALLKELPRDFHYCALGYGRPKTAPIVSYSELLGIPTCLWYLTGYVMSLSGAEHLWQKLPVVGPVDSWIGLMLTSNWDNVFGTALGVGVHAVTVSSGHFVAKRDLSRILQFRAFCACQPLCSQKVGGRKEKVPGGVGRSWRQQRDTDIVYSGDGSGLA